MTPEPSARTGVVIFDAYPQVYAGAQRVAHLQLRLLRDRGCRAALVAPAPGALVAAVAADGLVTSVVPAPPALGHYGRTTTGWRAVLAVLALPRYWAALRAELRRQQADVVHVNDLRGMLLAGVPARLAGARLVWHVHAIEPPSFLGRWGVRLADRVVVPAATVLHEMPHLRVGSKAVVVPNPAPVAPVPDEPVPGEPSLLVIARFHPDKGIDVLLEAMARLLDRVPDARLSVAGAAQPGWGRYGEAVVARAGELSGSVTLLGEVPSAAQHLRSHRVVVVPSRTEVLPLAVLEAMAAARAVVASDVGGLREVVVDGRTGLLVPPEDPAALAAALERALLEPQLAERLGEAGWARAQADYSPERFVSALVDVHADLGLGHPTGMAGRRRPSTRR